MAEAGKPGMNWTNELPAELLQAAYVSGPERAWPGAEAIQVIGSLAGLNLAVVGVEVWLPTEPGPTIPAPFFYAWSVERRAGETQTQYAARSRREATQYIADFEWDRKDKAHSDREPFFNLTIEESNDADGGE